jgi:hypothetical protein
MMAGKLYVKNTVVGINMNNEVQKDIDSILQGATGKVWQFTALRQYLQQNMILVDVNMSVQTPGFLDFLYELTNTGGNNVA